MIPVPVYTTYQVVLLVRLGRKEEQVYGPGHDDKHEAEKELNLVRGAQKAEEWIDLPWFSAKAEAVTAAYIHESSIGFG